MNQKKTHMKNNDEILERYLSDKSADFFGVQRQTLLALLPYKMAKPYLDSNYVMEHDNYELPEDEYWKDDTNAKDQLMSFMPVFYTYVHKGDVPNVVQGFLAIKVWLWVIDDGFYEEVESELINTVNESPEDLYYRVAKHIGYTPIIENIEFEELPKTE